MTAYNAKGDDSDPSNGTSQAQATKYLYTSAVNASWQTAAVYPDSDRHALAGRDHQGLDDHHRQRRPRFDRPTTAWAAPPAPPTSGAWCTTYTLRLRRPAVGRHRRPASAPRASSMARSAASARPTTTSAACRRSPATATPSGTTRCQPGRIRVQWLGQAVPRVPGARRRG